MTIKDLYEWAVENEAENLDVLVYRFDGEMTYLSEIYIEQRNGYKEIELL